MVLIVHQDLIQVFHTLPGLIFFLLKASMKRPCGVIIASHYVCFPPFVGTFVLQVYAGDTANPMASFTFQLTSNQFAIDSSTGAVTVASSPSPALDREVGVLRTLSNVCRNKDQYVILVLWWPSPTAVNGTRRQLE